MWSRPSLADRYAAATMGHLYDHKDETMLFFQTCIQSRMEQNNHSCECKYLKFLRILLTLKIEPLFFLSWLTLIMQPYTFRDPYKR